MTDTPKNDTDHQEKDGVSTSKKKEQICLLPPPELGLRVSRAEFARIMGVSRETVSKWVKSGKFKVGSDGRFCPRYAAKEILKNTNPNKLRTRTLRDAAEEAEQMREEIRTLKASVEDQTRRLGILEIDAVETEIQLDILPKLIIDDWKILTSLSTAQRLEAIRELIDTALIKAGDMRESGEWEEGQVLASLGIPEDLLAMDIDVELQ